jgi:Late embryogenesis abundant protein
MGILLAGCAAVPRIDAPRIAVVGVRFDGFDGMEARFALLVDLTNAGERELAVDAIAANLTIETVDVGTARLGAPVRVPPRGETPAVLEVRAAWAAALRAAALAARHARETGASGARYAVTGTATLPGGGTVPFSRSGEFVFATPP